VVYCYSIYGKFHTVTATSAAHRYSSTLRHCGHSLFMLANSWTCDAVCRHTTTSISHTKQSLPFSYATNFPSC